MVALKTERRVYLWRVAPKVKPAAAGAKGKATSLEEIVQILEGAHSAGSARVLLPSADSAAKPNAKNQIYIADIRRHPTEPYVTILMNRGDPNAANLSYLNVTTDGSVRRIPPRPPEALGWSAHLCISTESYGRGLHRACFERMPGLSVHLVLSALDEILERYVASNPTFTYPVVKTAQGKKNTEYKSYHPTFDVEQIPSERLIDDIETGELSMITLTRAAKDIISGMGQLSNVKRAERKLIIHTADTDSSATASMIKDVMDFAKEKNWEKVTFHIEKLEGNASKKPTIDVSEADALALLYSRTQRITGFEAILETVYEEVYLPIEKKMISLMDDAEGW